MFHINLSKERYCNGCHKLKDIRHFNTSRFFIFKESKKCYKCINPARYTIKNKFLNRQQRLSK